MNNLDNIGVLLDNPIIAAVSDDDSINEAILSPCDIIFLLESTIFNLKKRVDKIHKAGKLVLIHFDLIKGISNDITGLEYIKKVIVGDGIITTKAMIIKKARELGLITVQRIFILDSKSINAAIKSIQETKPDIIEVMPGVIPKVTKRICNIANIPVIAGGLIDKKHEIIELLDAGAIAISTSNKVLWYS